MSQYQRLYHPEGKYFFTLVTHGRKKILCSDYAIDRLRKAFRYTINKHFFELESIVILPDHLHCIWQLPENEDNFSVRWNMIKKYFSQGFESGKNDRREKSIWQRRYWEHLIRDEKDLEKHLNYIYYNPVKHGYVTRPIDWKFSSFPRDVEKGWYSKWWGSNKEPIGYIELDVE